MKTTSGLSILLHGIISLPDSTSHDKQQYYAGNQFRSIKTRHIAYKCMIPVLFFTCKCPLITTFAASLGPVHALQNFGPDPDPNCLVFRKDVFAVFVFC